MVTERYLREGRCSCSNDLAGHCKYIGKSKRGEGGELISISFDGKILARPRRLIFADDG